MFVLLNNQTHYTMSKISRNPITGDLETRGDYFTVTKTRPKTFVSLYLSLIKALQAELNLSVIEAVDIICDNRTFITNTIEIDCITEVKDVVKLIAAKY